MYNMKNKTVILCIAAIISLGIFSNEIFAVKEQTDEIYYSAPSYSESTVDFSHSCGFYTSPFTLTLSTELDGGIIYYTTDGSEPDKTSKQYRAGINIYDRQYEPDSLTGFRTTPEDIIFIPPYEKVFKGTVIKAKAYNRKGEMTRTFTSTYFVSPDIYERYGVKVISLSADKDDFFDSESGIYMPPNYENKGAEWERSAYMEVFDENGVSMLSQPVGVRINGGFTRRYQQKSLRIYARENNSMQNGTSKKFKFDPFDGEVRDIDGKPITSYKRLILRNSGDDWWNYRLKDAAAQKIAGNMGLLTEGYSPCVVFLNGEYWGVHDIRERLDEHYFQSRFNLINDSDVSMVEISADRDRADLSVSDENELEDFNKKIWFIINNDMAESENYQIAQDYFDLDNLIDYYCLNMFFENNDWPTNNVKIWRNHNPENKLDLKWRFVVSDMDGILEQPKRAAAQMYGILSLKCWNYDSGGTMEYILDYVPGLMSKMMKSLLNNRDFSDKLKSRYIECIDTYFTSENIENALKDIYYGIIHLRDEHRNRYPVSWESENIDPLIEYAHIRPDKAKREAEIFFNKLYK